MSLQHAEPGRQLGSLASSIQLQHQKVADLRSDLIRQGVLVYDSRSREYSVADRTPQTAPLLQQYETAAKKTEGLQKQYEYQQKKLQQVAQVSGLRTDASGAYIIENANDQRKYDRIVQETGALNTIVSQLKDASTGLQSAMTAMQQYGMVTAQGIYGLSQKQRNELIQLQSAEQQHNKLINDYNALVAYTGSHKVLSPAEQVDLAFTLLAKAPGALGTLAHATTLSKKLEKGLQATGIRGIADKTGIAGSIIHGLADVPVGLAAMPEALAKAVTVTAVDVKGTPERLVGTVSGLAEVAAKDPIRFATSVLVPLAPGGAGALTGTVRAASSATRAGTRAAIRVSQKAATPLTKGAARTLAKTHIGYLKLVQNMQPTGATAKQIARLTETERRAAQAARLKKATDAKPVKKPVKKPGAKPSTKTIDLTKLSSSQRAILEADMAKQVWGTVKKPVKKLTKTPPVEDIPLYSKTIDLTKLSSSQRAILEADMAKAVWGTVKKPVKKPSAKSSTKTIDSSKLPDITTLKKTDVKPTVSAGVSAEQQAVLLHATSKPVTEVIVNQTTKPAFMRTTAMRPPDALKGKQIWKVRQSIPQIETGVGKINTLSKELTKLNARISGQVKQMKSSADPATITRISNQISKTLATMKGMQNNLANVAMSLHVLVSPPWQPIFANIAKGVQDTIKLTNATIKVSDAINIPELKKLLETTSLTATDTQTLLANIVAEMSKSISGTTTLASQAISSITNTASRQIQAVKPTTLLRAETQTTLVPPFPVKYQKPKKRKLGYMLTKEQEEDRKKTTRIIQIIDLYVKNPILSFSEII